MSNTSVFRFVGPTTAISVSSSSSSAVTITPTGNDQINYLGLLNTGSSPIAVTIQSTSAPAAVLPTGGNSSNSIVLGITMSQPTVIAVPAGGGGQSFSITAVSSGSGTLYVMPMADQS
jgi:hypothetical protein